MRIPEDSPLRYYYPRHTTAGHPAPEPVDHAAAARDALARERSRARQLQIEEAARRKALAEATQPASGEERRKHDRRKNQQYVLLDTRATPSRRQASSVDIEV